MRQIVLLRGINLGSRNRIAMRELRELLSAAGHAGARTYLQSGNVVLSSDALPEELAREIEGQIAEKLGLRIEALARTRDELAAVVERDPLREVVLDPKRYQVSFLSRELQPEIASELAALATPSERFAAVGRELYAWHPHGVARSKLAVALAGRGLPVTATARNWTTVTSLLAMADEAHGKDTRPATSRDA
jgi:uncharacterized protein (DUF1697 family)